MNGDWKHIEKYISEAINKDIQLIQKSSISGGCINQCWKISSQDNQHWFVKTHLPKSISMFSAEEKGLEEITKSKSIRAPNTLCSGTTSTLSFLVLEYISLSPLGNQTEFAKQLVAMHQKKSNYFGWEHDNTIGSTHQSNTPTNSWISFWKNERLLPQLNLALKNGYPSDAYEAGLLLSENLESLLSNHNVIASLLHGDLWGGNCASDEKGIPVIFDPAVYYGDRETDIAMTELFGGFNKEFYAAYNDHFPLNEHYKFRKILYNLYHVLNHFNLFGNAYLLQAKEMTKKLLSVV